MWHEAIKGRLAEDVVSAFINFIQKNYDIQGFTFWAKNFSAQNKNWFLFTALANEVNKKNTLQSITLNNFEQGQTFISADSFHHQVEKKCRKKTS